MKNKLTVAEESRLLDFLKRNSYKSEEGNFYIRYTAQFKKIPIEPKFLE